MSEVIKDIPEGSQEHPIPKIFVSYSWTDEEHEEWVVDLATRLVEDSHVEVILDKWDLKEGQDTFSFMESMVNDPTISKVLVICDKGYTIKANNRKGGVGTESQIITPKVYGDIKQEKFIPIVAQRDSNGNHFIPTYMETRKYIDLSTDFEKGYLQLERTIHGKPAHRKPTIGKMPEHLIKEDMPRHLTNSIIKKMAYISEKTPRKLPFIWQDFKDAFNKTLDMYEIDTTVKSEIVFLTREKTEQLILLRNDYINAIEIMLVSEQLKKGLIIEFFEDIYIYTRPKKEGTFFDHQFDHYKFLLREIVLYTITILLKFDEYELISDLLLEDYYLDKDEKSIMDFDFRLSSLNVTDTKKINVQAYLINKHLHDKYGKNVLEADLILHYISDINYIFEDSWKKWFPISYIYLTRGKKIRFLTRLKSLKYFEEVASIFGLDTEKESVTKFRNLIDNMNERVGYTESFENVPNLSMHISSKEFCTRP